MFQLDEKSRACSSGGSKVHVKLENYNKFETFWMKLKVRKVGEPHSKKKLALIPRETHSFQRGNLTPKKTLKNDWKQITSCKLESNEKSTL